MIASLHARLIALVLAITAVGLLLLGSITYAEQRSFLRERVDQQVHAAVGPVARQLDSAEGYEARGGIGGLPKDDRQPGGGSYGTYGVLLDASGKVVKRFVDKFGDEQAPAAPKLPSSMPTGKIVTVGAVDGELRYRALAIAGPDAERLVVAVPLSEADRTLDRLAIVEGLVITSVLIVLGLLAWLLVRVGLRPLDRIGQTAGAIAAGDLSRRVEPADERTEVGRLGLALNAMLERLEHAFAERQASENRLRRFLSDASHELRTPLASIRGYAELFRIGAARDPAGRAKAMRRIEDEAARMGVLVEDLLTLARLDELREPVRQPVDLARVAADAVADARATAPDREITLHAEGPAVVAGDPDQLRQVLANLLRNALVHTPDGTPIDVSAYRAGDRARLEVRDHGPGLPTSDAQALFERFWRAEAGRERGRAGAGLGLAIVAGIVDAHGGSAGAANAVDGGAVFTIELPAAS